ncbi:DUF3093 domain-containing protein [Pseudokineococcus lusitanus]|uniref:DUF3093 family protein n=1 Tax=Pseudokineococcus lusitanus TaxID=763993 RepID=A0A3N1G8W9_9ACTN|nr:DUF3093 domain-containing protein [Pseudokineococcus lusitanus]ROP26664.1 hypothetical protein EDC03_3301 [Pseudokineococcus lusitanus]
MVRGSSTDGTDGTGSTGGTGGGTAPGAAAYRERVLPSAGSWVAAPALAALAGLAAGPLGVGVVAVVVVVVAGVVAAVLLAWSPVVEVADGELRAGRARIPLAELGAATGYDGEDARQQRGPALDARAHVLMRGWADGVVRVEVTDPDDPAPYWLVSTHRPRRLAAALQPRG